MPRPFKCLAILSRGLASPKTRDILFSQRGVIVVFHNQSRSLNSDSIQNKMMVTLQDKLNIVNEHYERATGIADIRRIQSHVLEAECRFVDIAKQRKMCQDQMDNLKSRLSTVRDKLESTARSSEIYLQLVTDEHKLLREQLTLEVQLSQLKDKEQETFDCMSKLLRQSHELERLRQERSKYWQIISITLSLAGSLVALIAQRVRNQNSTIKRLESLETNLLLFNDKLDSSHQQTDAFTTSVLDKLDDLEKALGELVTNRDDREVDQLQAKPNNGYGWWSYIPGLTTVISWRRYLF